MTPKFKVGNQVRTSATSFIMTIAKVRTHPIHVVILDRPRPTSQFNGKYLCRWQVRGKWEQLEIPEHLLQLVS